MTGSATQLQLQDTNYGFNTNPGPGHYDRSCDWQPHCSLGHKGYGFLASNTSRLSSRVEYTGPGPASYSPRDPSSRRTRSAAFFPTAPHASVHASALQAASSSSEAADLKRQYVPSTTHKGDSITWTSSKRPGASAAFKAVPRSPLVPGSSEYLAREQQKLQQASKTPEWVRQSVGPAAPRQPSAQHKRSTVTSCTNQRQWKPSTSAHLAYRTAAAVFGTSQCEWSVPRSAAQTQTGHCCLFEGTVRAASQVPGPGAYSPALSLHSHQRGSPMFAQPLAATSPSHRAQQQKEAVAVVQQHMQGCLQHACKQRPYPGNSSRPWGSVRCASAPFRSTAPGHESALITSQDALKLGMPGPAYYSNKSAARKTTFRQANGTFVAVV